MQGIVREPDRGGVILRTVLHVGPVNSKGGMGAVIQILAANPPINWKAETLPSHADGGKIIALLAWWRVLRRLRKRLKQGRIDLVHIHTASRWSWTRKKMLIKIVRKAGLPVVLSFHSGDFDRHCEKHGEDVRKVCCDQGVHPVLLSTDWQMRLSKWIEESTVIPNPCPDVEINVERDRTTFLLMGRKNPMKGQEIAIQAAAMLIEQGHNVTIHMTGIQKNYPGVIGHGWVDGEDKEHLLSTCGTLLSPSEWEGLSMTIIEAMARGMPIIASEASEGVFSNSGRIVERSPSAFAEAMVEMMDGDQWTEMAESGPKEAEIYRLENVTQQWMALYNQVMELSE